MNDGLTLPWSWVIAFDILFFLVGVVAGASLIANVVLYQRRRKDSAVLLRSSRGEGSLRAGRDPEKRG